MSTKSNPLTHKIKHETRPNYAHGHKQNSKKYFRQKILTKAKVKCKESISFTDLLLFIMLALLINNIIKHKKKSFVEPLQKLLMDDVEFKIMLCH